MNNQAPHAKRFIGNVVLIDDSGQTTRTVECNHHHAYYKAIFDAMEIAAKKNNDYAGGTHEHPLANFLESTQSGIDPKQGLWLRMTDKIGRIKTFFKTGKLAVTSEPVADAFLDLGNYAFLMLALLEDQDENAKTSVIRSDKITTPTISSFTDPYDKQANNNAAK